MENKIAELFARIEAGELSADEALNLIKKNEMIGDDYFIDRHRKQRLGFDEIIFGMSKTVDQIAKITDKYKQEKLDFICTGLDDRKIDILKKRYPEFEFIPKAGIMKNISSVPPKIKGKAAIITAGTSDAKVAHETGEILNCLGVNCEKFIDIGVAGIHRIFHFKKEIAESNVLIVIAGMEGALPTVIGGIFAQPVVAVPASVGYGVSAGGYSALLSMLSSCAGGITVVNIDNGFGAAMAAFRILKSGQVEK
ncbi:1-(5-phosphoribosyl)-5-amino-4-imidazole- carboxylate (AIR) carboxylase [Flexistipes sinusarabici DSM 4947]|uniref:1-(5-phosphoribosyl)-5-amino-4-imidazole-carboxylate (AIR) carboxylase n=3 Tax=Flexistipes sinusarabici TaxID=2352 RepID=F8E853_FLESM|nr:nickel pincer cofactor biosynthesis protein LarB [Flexistipes sinusarabici]AEI13977.1 1-(5-phosphoribosyl)-5-amino-4-imidazole- carboxylate (AIR) carboxylase [Flexistipes sinusarabici DSM 4947]